MLSHPKEKKYMIAFSSFYLDCMFLFFAYHFIRYSNNPRILYAAGFFYGARALCQALFLFQFPIGYTFDDPNVFSLMVPYGTTSDFYFSGHCGILLLINMELYHMGYVHLSWANFLFLGYMASVMIGTRGHYSIGRLASPDIFIGILCGFYAQMISFKIKALVKACKSKLKK